MLTVKPTSKFKKELQKAQKSGKDISKLNIIIKKLANEEPLPAENKDNQLKGNFKGFRECHIEPDWLLIYKIYENQLILSLERTGSHSDLF